MVTVEQITAVYAKIENRPGNLQRLTRAVAERNVNIDAISAETVGETGIVRFTTHKPRECVDALRHLGIEAYESQILVANIPNRPNQLQLATAELAAATINIEGVFTTPEGRLAFRTSDNDRAAQILRKL